jgi:hypothetical protein
VTRCHTDQSRSGGELFRPTRNRFRHEPWVKDATTGLPRRNELGFAKRQLHKCLKPLYIAAVDFEAANVSVVEMTTTPPEQPKGAVFKQTALGWGVAYRALYGHLPLPKELDSVRMQFLKEEEDETARSGDDASCRRGVLSNEDRLILTLLETIREDAYLIGAYLADVFINKTVPVRPFNELSHEEKTAYHSKLNCDICGLKFGEKFLASDGLTVRTRYKVRDHDHLQFAGDDRCDRFLLCHRCNLNLQNGVGSSRWLAYRYFLHNGERE